MKTLKVLLQEVVSGIKAWVNSNFAQESNAVHKTGDETITGNKTFSGESTYTNDNLDFTFTDFTIGDSVNANKIKRLRWFDSANNRYGCIAVNYGTDKSVFMDFPLSTKNTAGTGTVNKTVRFQLNPDNTSAFQPTQNNLTDLGTSAYQWNSVYAKNYYYNGTAWGLDKANVWTANQTVSINLPTITLQDTIGVRNTTPTNTRNLTFSFLDKNGDSYGFINRQHKTTGTHLHQVSIRDGTYDYRLQFYLFEGGLSSFMPSNDGVIELGTSSYRWKTFNGLNPGDLSLPDYDSNAKLEFTSEFPTPDSSGNIRYTPTMNGWLYVYFDVSSATINSGSVLIATIKDANMTNANCAQMFWRSPPASDLLVFFPVVANKQFIIQINFTGYTLKKALLIPGMGYVE